MSRGEPQVPTDPKKGRQAIARGEPLAGPVPLRSPQTDGHPMGYLCNNPVQSGFLKSALFRCAQGRAGLHVYWPMIFEGFGLV